MNRSRAEMIRLRSGGQLGLRSAHTLRGLLQERNLPRMIELMLRDAVKHVIEVVALAGNAVAQARFRKGCNCFHKLIVSFLCRRNCLSPRGFRWFLWRCGKIG